MTTPTRGVRNNNPGNIRKNGTPWDGLAPIQADTEFFTFINPEHGVRAIVKILMTYQDTYHLHTVRGMISRWAPPNENNTSAYVNFVAAAVGVGPDTAVNIRQRDTARKLVAAIVAQENARYSYPDEVIEAGLTLAGVLV